MNCRLLSLTLFTAILDVSAAPSPIARSLVFDQTFDTQAVRPAPMAKSTPHQINQTIATETPLGNTTINVKRTDASISSQPNRIGDTGLLKLLGRLKTWQRIESASRESRGATPAAASKPDVAESVVVAQGPELKPAQKVVESADQNIPQTAVLNKISLPNAKTGEARVVVLDNEQLSLGIHQGVQNAVVHWIAFNSKIQSRVPARGWVRAPYPRSSSLRFIVQAPGYLPALGYAVEGELAIVPLVKERLLPAVVKTLGVIPDPTKSMVFAQFLNNKKALSADVSLEANIQNPFRIFYAAGALNIFHPAKERSGTNGAAYISGISQGLQYLLPTDLRDNSQPAEWPATLVDMNLVGPVVSVGVAEGTKLQRELLVTDAFTLERPSNTRILATIGGQRGLAVAGEDGTITLEQLRTRANVDLIEVSAPSYLTTWISAAAANASFPTNVPLLSQSHVQTLTLDARNELDLNRAIVFGSLRPQEFRKPVTISVYGADGKKVPDALVYSFDESNQRLTKDRSTHPNSQTFVIGNLPDGEFHVIAFAANTDEVLAIQIVRAKAGVVSFLQF